MKWETRTPDPAPRSYVLHIGNVLRLDVDDRGADCKTWQYCQLSFGEFSELSPGECRETWPREVLERLRTIVADLEKSLESDE